MNEETYRSLDDLSHIPINGNFLEFFLQFNNLTLEDLDAIGILNLDILSAHGSYNQEKAYRAACLAEPRLARFFMKATVMKQSIIIPDGKGGFIIKILKEGGIQGVLSTGILFKHLTGPIVLKLKNIMGFENAGIEDDIAINGTLFQRIG